MTTQEILAQAKATATAGVLTTLPAERKNEALEAMAAAVEAAEEAILAANAEDMEAARGHIADVMLDRLLLTPARIAGMAAGIRDVIALPDPVGRVLAARDAAQGIHLTKVAVPLGVVAIIYESRPNVTSDAAALCLKSGNVCVLRGGKEAFRTSRAIVEAMREGLAKVGLPETLINMLEDTTRAGATELMKALGLVDCLIPRGGAGLIRSCVENATVPVIQTGTGICSVYVDAAADLAKALPIIINAKTQRPSVCNAEEQLLVHRDVAAAFLPQVKAALVDDRVAAGLAPVELRLDEEAAQIIPGTPAGPADFDTEFLDYILAVKVVGGVEEAVAHIAAHSTHHSDAIITEDEAAAAYFTSRVDSAAVYVNVSTRFTDGGMFGLGCEMGISTQKLHARGPMGLEELTSYKYVVTGEGQTRN
ncbi:MAG: glutamate-5-semialdehyde dehydrogenase [Eggerthellaceae bacterium]|nr:glutamate-5-semialdehyde dehydrogenase [Eggerthellaceae bacterium]